MKLNEQQLTLLQMMYTSDISAETATEQLGISFEDLEKIVNELIQCEMLKALDDNEIELTEKGIKYITKQTKKNLEES